MVLHGSCPCVCAESDWHGSSGIEVQEALKTMKKDSRAMYTAKSFDHLRGLTGLSDAQVTEHLDLYAGYVKQVNSLVQELSEMGTERGASGKDFSLAEGTHRLDRRGPAPARIRRNPSGVRRLAGSDRSGSRLGVCC